MAHVWMLRAPLAPRSVTPAGADAHPRQVRHSPAALARRGWRWPWLLGSAWLCVCPAWAEEPISTDRPDFVESSNTVGRGRFQIETSVAWARDRQDGLKLRAWSLPTLLRWGISDDWELRLETEGPQTQTSTTAGVRERQRGWTDLSFGAKWHVHDGDEARGIPAMAWLFHVDGDTGSAAFRGQGWRPSVRLTAEWELPADLSLGVMGGAYRDRDEQGRRYVGGILAATVGAPLAERVRGFVELAGQQLVSQRHGGRVITADLGLTWQPRPDVQLDTAVARGVSRAAPDWGWTLGLSLKF